MSTAVTKPALKELTLAQLLRQPEYADRFKQVLGERAGEFTSSILSVGMTMPDVDPLSIVQAGMKGAALELPVEKSLGFAWIVPFMERGKKLAQFQIGYKGFIQLALRTGHYLRMNVRPINAEALKGYDEVGEPVIDWMEVDETKPPIGYAFGWKLTNGFTKICYWSKEKVEAHALRYSQAYAKGYNTPWKTHFDQMAMKTVVKNELARWGILSIQFQRAIEMDQQVTDSTGSRYPDGQEVNLIPDLTGDSMRIEDSIPLPTENPAVDSLPSVPYAETTKPSAPSPSPEPSSSATDATVKPSLSQSSKAVVIDWLNLNEVPEGDFVGWLASTGRIKNKITGISELTDELVAKLMVDKGLDKCVILFGKKPQPKP